MGLQSADLRSSFTPTGAPRLPWLTPMRGLAIAMIVFYHVVIPIYGIPWFAHPRNDWPDLAARVAQLRPLPQETPLHFILANLFRYLGWIGYQGTGVFLAISGFGLTWALVSRSRSAAIDLRAFYMRRFLRLFPLYWVGHLFFLIFNNLSGWRPFSPLDPRFALSLLGLRFLPDVFHFISPAWWFIVLIMQLYAVFPLLWAALRRFGLLRFWIGAALIAFASRWVGFFLLPVDREMWSRGLLFTSRLAEFGLGMGLAWWAAGDLARVEGLFRTRTSMAALALLYGAGLALSFTRLGAVFAPTLLTIAMGGFMIWICRDLLPRLSPLQNLLAGMGRYSYGIMVFHQPILWSFIVGTWPLALSLPVRLLAIGVVVAGIALGSAVVESGVNWLLQRPPLSRVFPPPGPYAIAPALGSAERLEILPQNPLQ